MTGYRRSTQSTAPGTDTFVSIPNNGIKPAPVLHNIIYPIETIPAQRLQGSSPQANNTFNRNNTNESLTRKILTCGHLYSYRQNYPPGPILNKKEAFCEFAEQFSTNDVVQIDTKRITDDTHRFHSKVRATRLDTAHIGPFHVTTVGKFLNRHTSFFSQFSDSRRDIRYFLLIANTHFKNSDKKFCHANFIIYICTVRIIYDT